MKHFKIDLYRGFHDNGKSSRIVNMNPVIVALLDTKKFSILSWNEVKCKRVREFVSIMMGVICVFQSFPLNVWFTETASCYTVWVFYLELTKLYSDVWFSHKYYASL